jgi:ATP-dependent DNA helicase PIF1
MMSVKLLEILDELGKRTRGYSKGPFGGIQVVLSGDFYQLPPVGDKDEPDTYKFCFESSEWNTIVDEIICLKTMFRQTDPVYAKILNQIRVGKLYRSSFDTLQKCIGKRSDELVRPTILLPRRRDVDNINEKELAKLDTEVKVFNLEIEGVPEKSVKHTANEVQKLMEIRFLRSGMMVDDKLILKIGAQVMCVANIDMEGPHPIVNGSQGIVVEFVNDLPMVQFRDGQKRIIGKHRWSSETIESVGVQQIPLIHAWAITIHKAQGVTLELAQIDAGSNIFECGQTYVALSRVKSLEGLYLTALNPGKIKVNKKVQEFYSDLNHKVSQTQE